MDWWKRVVDQKNRGRYDSEWEVFKVGITCVVVHMLVRSSTSAVWPHWLLGFLTSPLVSFYYLVAVCDWHQLAILCSISHCEHLITTYAVKSQQGTNRYTVYWIPLHGFMLKLKVVYVWRILLKKTTQSSHASVFHIRIARWTRQTSYYEIRLFTYSEKGTLRGNVMILLAIDYYMTLIFLP